jgi:PPOX class probable F420-dependent enzyme
VSVLNAAARGLIESGKPAHLVTVNPDGSPQVTMVWVGLNGEELVSGHLDDRQKLRNVRRDPRVVLSLETGVVNDFGLAEYVTVTGPFRRVRTIRPGTSCTSRRSGSAASVRGATDRNDGSRDVTRGSGGHVGARRALRDASFSNFPARPLVLAWCPS